jgi:hypothetical protein
MLQNAVNKPRFLAEENKQAYTYTKDVLGVILYCSLE